MSEEMSIAIGPVFPDNSKLGRRYYAGTIYWKDRNNERNEYMSSMFIEKEDYIGLSEKEWIKTKNKMYHLIVLGLLRNRFGDIDYSKLR